MTGCDSSCRCGGVKATAARGQLDLEGGSFYRPADNGPSLIGSIPMKVVILSETYAEAMGYAGTCIPAAMAKIPGVEVHYVTAGLPVYYNAGDFKKTYAEFQKSEFRPGDQRSVQGYTVHYLEPSPT